MARDLSYYLSLNYRYQLEADAEDGGFFASHPELPGCFAQGETADEAIDELDAAREVWLEVRLEEGLPIPEPREDGEFSGKLTLRLPPSLHRSLSEQAAQEQTSLNSWITLVLAERQARIEAIAAVETKFDAALRQLDMRLSSIQGRLGAVKTGMGSGQFSGEMRGHGMGVDFLRPESATSFFSPKTPKGVMTEGESTSAGRAYA